MDTKTCYQFAEYFEALSCQLRTQAAEKAKYEAMNLRNEAIIKGVNEVGKISYFYMQNGTPQNEAVSIASNLTGISELSVEMSLKQVQKNILNMKIKARNVEILLLRNRNWSNPDIATRFNIDVSTVGRIIKKELEK